MATENSNNQQQPSKAEQEAAAKLKETQAKLEKAEAKLKELEEKEAADKLKAEQEAAAKAEAQKEKEKSQKPFKVKHKDEEYTFPASEKGNFIVRHSKMFKSPTGQSMEDPGSVRTQIYRPEVYADLIHENEATGEQNAFVQSGEKTIVLHDPTK